MRQPVGHSPYTVKYSFIDKTGALVIDGSKYQSAGSFSDGLAPVYVASRGWGFIDKEGKEAIAPRFEAARSFSEGLSGIKIGGRWGFIDKTGHVVIEPQFEMVSDFNEGLAVVTTGDKVVMIDKTGRIILRVDTGHLELNIYEDPKVSEGLIEAFDRVTSRYGFIDTTGKFVIEPKYNKAAPFSEGLARVTTLINDEEKVGFINRGGQFVIQPLYNTDADFRRNSTNFSAGLASLSEGLRPSMTEEGKIIYIDKQGAVMLSIDFSYAGMFRDERAMVYDAESDKWGFIDKSGKVVIPLQYDLASDFSEGVACVAKIEPDGLFFRF